MSGDGEDPIDLRECDELDRALPEKLLFACLMSEFNLAFRQAPDAGDRARTGYAAPPDPAAPRRVPRDAAAGASVHSASVRSIADAAGIGLADLAEAIESGSARADDGAGPLCLTASRRVGRGIESMSLTLSCDPYAKLSAAGLDD